MTAALWLLPIFLSGPPGERPQEPAPPAAAQEPDIQAYKERLVPAEYRPFRSVPWELVDLGVLVALLAAAAVLAIRRSPWRRMLGLAVFALLYLGFLRGGCLCPIGAVVEASRGILWPEEAGRIAALLFLVPLAAALVAGRVFCGGACPLGAAQYLVFLGSRPRRIPAGVERALRVIPWGILAATVWLAVRGGCLLVCRLDPFVTAFAHGQAWFRKFLSLVGLVFVEPGPVAAGDAAAWAWLCGALALSMVVPMPFCRYLCPYGALLGLFSRGALCRKALPAGACTGCGACARVCPVQAIGPDRPGGPVRVNQARCIRCGRCDGACPRAKGT